MENRHSFLCLTLFFAAQVVAQEAPATVQQDCARCHGLDGIATKPAMPHLNGQLDNYLIASMKKMQKGRLPTDVQHHVPVTLAENELVAIAQYYQAIKVTRPNQETDPDKVARGEVVFRNRCNDCHGDNGREADKDAPLMAAQNLQHMIKQIALFVSGKRKFGFLQDDAFKGLSQEELESVAHFFASQDQIAPPAPTVGSGKKKRR
jgi:cytochrome c553